MRWPLTSRWLEPSRRPWCRDAARDIKIAGSQAPLEGCRKRCRERPDRSSSCPHTPPVRKSPRAAPLLGVLGNREVVDDQGARNRIFGSARSDEKPRFQPARRLPSTASHRSIRGKSATAGPSLGTTTGTRRIRSRPRSCSTSARPWRLRPASAVVNPASPAPGADTPAPMHPSPGKPRRQPPLARSAPPRRRPDPRPSRSARTRAGLRPSNASSIPATPAARDHPCS